ncbi:hypothetical protein EON80_05505 [bacterium]|nr:MAG: hypothetical protein EON80_05505 [bacterium]
METQVIATPVCDLTANLPGSQFRLTVGAKRDILALSTIPNASYQQARINGINQYHSRIHHWKDGEVSIITLPPMPQRLSHVQPLGNDYVCLDGRCEKDEPNLHVFDNQGHLLRSWHAGDGVLDVQTFQSDQIWVSFFDEGVFSGGLGSQGLVCFDAQGQRNFGFRDCPRGEFEIQEIIDCYALNVTSSRDTWLCYYTDFPVVHLQEKRLHQVFRPAPEMIGCHAFAVKGSFLLFVGGYHHRGQIFWRDETKQMQFELEVIDENGEPLVWKYARGRGADLFLFDGAKVWMLSLHEISF